MSAYRLLTFDIGGTKTNVALFNGRTEDPMALAPPLFSHAYQNDDFDGPEALLDAALRAAGAAVDMVVLAVAGPVDKEGARLTNRPWSFGRADLKAHFSLPHLHIINDLEALALGVPYLDDKELQVINDQPVVPEATIAVIAPGTGLGESFLTWIQGRHIAHPTEGSHSDFAPVETTQIELLQFMLQTYGHVSYERLCSGLGLHNIYRFLKDRLGMAEPAWLGEKFGADQDPTKTIITAANDASQSCDICRRTVEMFIAILGAEAGNLALRTLPRGGLYIGGGIPPRIRSFFRSGHFMAAFRHKGRMQPLLETIPVKMILNPRIPLYGAAYYGLQCPA